MWDLVGEVRAKLADTLHPDAFTIGVNDGTAAGQTVPHAHVHVIPRWTGDVPDPRGGVRWVIPGKAAARRVTGADLVQTGVVAERSAPIACRNGRSTHDEAASELTGGVGGRRR